MKEIINQRRYIWKPPNIGDIFYSYSSSFKEIHTFSDIGDGWNKLGPLQSRQWINNWKYDYGKESEIRNITGNWVLFRSVRVWVNQLAFQFNKMHNKISWKPHRILGIGFGDCLHLRCKKETGSFWTSYINNHWQLSRGILVKEPTNFHHTIHDPWSYWLYLLKTSGYM